MAMEPSAPLTAAQVVERSQMGVGHVQAIVSQSLNESQFLVQQTGFADGPTVSSANYIVAQMKRWELLLHEHRRTAERLCIEYGDSAYLENVHLALLNLEDFLAWIRSVKSALIGQNLPSARAPAQPMPGPMAGAFQQAGTVPLPFHHTPPPFGPAAAAPASGPPASDGQKSFAAQFAAADQLDLQRLKEFNKLREEQRANELKSGWANMASHSEAVRSLL
jgi:hypothetical protein